MARTPPRPARREGTEALVITDAPCDGCSHAARRAAETRATIVCVCERTFTPPRRLYRFEAARDIPLLVRWLPELLARSPAMARATGSPGHNGASASAHGGRLDHIDESRGYSRAVETCRHLRACVAADHGSSVAILWAAYALVPEPEVPDDRRLRAARCNAIALGAAPAKLREEWRERAAETDRTALVRAPLVITTGFSGDLAQHREVIRTSVAILSTKGPSFEAQAARWGAENLALLWMPGAVPDDVARGVAVGFAAERERKAWQTMRQVLREGAIRSWAEALIREAVVRTEANDHAGA